MMKPKHTQLSRWIQTSLLLGAAIGLVRPVWADDEDLNDEDSETIEVLGSRIKRVDKEGASPVISIGRAEIDKKGFTNVSEVIASLGSATGSNQQQFSNDFTPSASSVNLRGMGVGRSLILVDGRRIPQFPLAAGGEENFVDLASIPMAAIERIDVLSDGASAIYGSDAISGVVNIVTRKNLEGHSVSARVTSTAEGGGTTKKLEFSSGFQGEATNVSVYGEFSDRDALNYSDRERSRDDVLDADTGLYRLVGNTFYRFGPDGLERPIPLGYCPQDQGMRQFDDPYVRGPVCGLNVSSYKELQAPLKRQALQGVVTHQLSDTTELSLRTSWVHTEVDSFWEPQNYERPVGPDDFNNPTRGTAEAEEGRYLRTLTEWGPRGQSVDSDSVQLVGQISGVFENGYDWKAGVSYGQQEVDSQIRGFVLRDAMDERFYDGRLDLSQEVSADLVAETRATPYTRGESTLYGADLQLNGDLFEMPAGPVMFAAILEANHQEIADRPDQQRIDGLVEGLGGSSSVGERDYAAIGAEFLVPLHETLNVNLAGRYDRYFDDSNVAGAFSPKLSFEYRPLDGLLLRGSVGNTFRAPDMQRLFAAPTTQFDNVRDTPQCLAEGGTGLGDRSVQTCVRDLNQPVLVGSNLELEEEKGRSYNLGAVWQATEGLNVEVGLWKVELEGIVSSPYPQYVLDNPEEFPEDWIIRDPNEVGPTNPGGLVGVRAQAFNLAFQEVTGADIGIDYEWQSAEFGDFRTELTATYFHDYKIQGLASEPIYNDFDGRDGRKDAYWKGGATLDWKLNNWSAMVYADYTGGFAFDEGFGQLGSYTKINLSAAYELPWQGQVRVGINNALDRQPPLLDDFGISPFTALDRHDLHGRGYYLEYSQRF